MVDSVHYHLPGLFEFYDFYRVFLPIFRERREWFYDWCDIASIYGAPEGALWGGGRTSFGKADVWNVLNLMKEFGISARLTFSNSLLREEHLADKECNTLCRIFEEAGISTGGGIVCGADDNLTCSGIVCGAAEKSVQNGVIVHSDLLAGYLKEKYTGLYLVSSTTKVLTDFEDFRSELNRLDFKYVVPDFRLNKEFELLEGLSHTQKDKVEFLCNECCDINCQNRKACYENVSRKNLGQNVPDHKCTAKDGEEGYKFSKAMKNPAFIGIGDIQKKYLPMGFSNFKIEGRGLGSAMIFEFLLYFMTKPEHQLELREAVYLDSMLDLF